MEANQEFGFLTTAVATSVENQEETEDPSEAIHPSEVVTPPGPLTTGMHQMAANAGSIEARPSAVELH